MFLTFPVPTRTNANRREQRERDFRGLEIKSFDGRGNYSIGIKEHIIFPEIDYDKVDKIRGLDICITTSAEDDNSGEALLRAMKFPFKN